MLVGTAKRLRNPIDQAYIFRLIRVVIIFDYLWTLQLLCQKGSAINVNLSKTLRLL